MPPALQALTQGAPAAAVILALMVGASLFALYRSPALLERHLLRPYWLVPRKQYATVITSGFLHADLPHLLFNAFTFWAFGFSLERAIGTPTFLALYLFGLLASAAGTWFAHRHQRDYASLGASGAILAVLFASIVHTPTQSIFIFPIPLPIPAPLFALLYLGFTIYAAKRPMGGVGGRINHDAHLAGAVAGVVFVLLTDAAAFGRALRQVLG